MSNNLDVMQPYYDEVDTECAHYYRDDVAAIADRLATPLQRMAMHYAIGEITELYETAVMNGGLEDAQALYEHFHEAIESGAKWSCLMPESLEQINEQFYSTAKPWMHNLAARVVRYSKNPDVLELAQWLERIGRYDISS